MSDPEQKLQDCAEQNGFENGFDLVDAYMGDSVMPGICMNEDCEYSTNVEPDQTEGYCEECDSTTVKSALELMMET